MMKQIFFFNWSKSSHSINIWCQLTIIQENQLFEYKLEPVINNRRTSASKWNRKSLTTVQPCWLLIQSEYVGNVRLKKSTINYHNINWITSRNNWFQTGWLLIWWLWYWHDTDLDYYFYNIIIKLKRIDINQEQWWLVRFQIDRMMSQQWIRQNPRFDSQLFIEWCKLSTDWSTTFKIFHL